MMSVLQSTKWSKAALKKGRNRKLTLPRFADPPSREGYGIPLGEAGPRRAQVSRLCVYVDFCRFSCRFMSIFT